MRLAAALVLSTLALPASAAARTYDHIEAGVRVSGAIAVAFEGDPATCAPVGRCGMRGTITWDPSPVGELDVHRAAAGRREILGGVGFGVYGTDDVERATAQIAYAGGASCSTTRDTLTGLELSGGPSAVRIAFDPEDDVLRTSCGGPLMSDVLPVLPSVATTYVRLRRGRTTLDLRGDRPFAAGGLRGTVRSSVVLRIGKATTLRTGTAQPRRRRDDARVTSVTGTVGIGFTSSLQPGRCETRGGCGLSGTATIHHVLGRGEPADLGARYGGAFWSERGTMTWQQTGPPGVEPCSDEVPLIAAGVVILRSRRLEYGAFGGIPFPRTRCPGPLLDEAEGPAPGGATSSQALARRDIALRLDRPVTNTTPGFTLRLRPDLTVGLRRRR